MGVLASIRRATTDIPGNLQGMFWLALSGITFSVLNMLMRRMSLELDPYLTQFWRYFLGLLLILPMFVREGLNAMRTSRFGLQVVRNIFHAVGLTVWFTALGQIPLAEMTTIGFTGPLFITIGAALFLREDVRARRWIAIGIGFLGVLIVLRPGLGDLNVFTLVMLCSAPLFAGSFLLAKVLTRYDSATAIVAWQSTLVSLFSLPVALYFWQWPSWEQMAWLTLCGVMGSVGHMSMVQAFKVAEISAIQPINFLNLIWATTLGYLVFADVPAVTTWIGAAIIFAAATYIARREAMAAKADRADKAARAASLPEPAASETVAAR